MNRKLALFAFFLLPMVLFLVTCGGNGGGGGESNPSPGTPTQTDISVTSTTDVVNGDISSISALIANPGPDGISLREAITAANSEAGPHTITFSPTLIGQTISLTSRLPDLTRGQVTIAGIKDTEGEPAVTIARPSSGPPGRVGILQVLASDFTISDMRIVNALGVAHPAIFIGAGSVPDTRVAPARIANVYIQGCIFSNSGLSKTASGIFIATNRGGGDSPGATITDVTIAKNRFSDNAMVQVEAGGTNSLIQNVAIVGNEFSNEGVYELGNGLAIGTSDFSSGASISNMTITDNSFTNFKANVDAIAVGGAGTNGQINKVLISGNRFSDSNYPIEMAQTGINCRTSGTQILRNAFANNFQTITLGAMSLLEPGWPSSSGNIIEDTVISGNIISDSEAPAIHLSGGLATASRNSISNTTISNNLIMGGGASGIRLIGGDSGASENRIQGVRIVNNTITWDISSVGIRLTANLEGAVGNSVTDVAIINTILWGEGVHFFGEVTPDQVSHSITSAPGFFGVNGNFSADPLFVNPTRGDFHLRPGSPGIDAGTSQGAPETDLEGHARFDDPATVNTGSGEVSYYDLGCFEYHGL